MLLRRAATRTVVRKDSPPKRSFDDRSGIQAARS